MKWPPQYDDDGEPLIDALAIASAHKVRVGTVRVWAHRRGVEPAKYGPGGIALYRRCDVLRFMAQ